MMNKVFLLLFFLFSLNAFAIQRQAVCFEKKNVIAQGPINDLSLSVEQISCFASRQQYQCADLEKSNLEEKTKIIQCDQYSLKQNKITETKLFYCAFNGLKMSAEQLLELAKLPGLMAKAVLVSLKESQECSSNLNKKRELLNAFNLSISDKRFELEESFLGRSFEDMSCTQLEQLIHARYDNYNQQIYREMISAKTAGKPYKNVEEYEQKNSSLIRDINQALNLAKISYECYTPKIKAEMLCAAVTSLITDMALGAGVTKAAMAIKRVVKAKNAVATTSKIELTSEAIKENNEAPVMAFRPEWMRSNKMTGEYRQILKSWKPASSKARALSEQIAYKQMNELGLKSFSFTVKAESLPASSAISETALKNPQMAEYLKKMNEAGFELRINPHMAVDSDYGATLGRFNPPLKAIEILPNATWEVFQHEYQHMVFYNLGLRTHVLATDAMTSAEKKIVSRAADLYKKGFKSLAVDETMAVEAEIKTLYKMGYTPWSGPVYEARKYAWSFQEKDVAKGFANSSEATKIAFKKVALNPYVVRTALGLSTGTAIYYNEKEEKIITIDEKGNAKKFRIDEMK